MKTTRDYIENAIYIVLIMSIMTLLLCPTILVCLFFSDMLMLFVLMFYTNRRNQLFYQKILLMIVSAWGSIIVTKLIIGKRIRLFSREEFFFFCILLIELFFVWKHCSKERAEEANRKPLYRERWDDLERVKYYMKQINLLGVNGGWGSGKTFLTTCLWAEEDIKKEYEVIQIDLLSCNLNEVEYILITEIEKVFKRNGIFPDNSYAIKQILGKSKWTELLGRVFFQDLEGMAVSFESYRKAFARLDKKIVIIFEDIDRISEKNTIKKIFAIAERIACDEMHVIFQFDCDEMEELGFDRRYLEKYIPYIVNLTDIPFEDIVEYQLRELDMADIGIKKETITPLLRRVTNAFQVEQITGVSLNLQINLDVSIRKVHIFLEELKIILTENADLRKKGIKETVVAILFVKHFFYDIYKIFRIGKSPYEQLCITYKESEYTVQGFLQAVQKKEGESEQEIQERLHDIQECMNDKDNRFNLGIILLLGYDIFLPMLKNRKNQKEDVVLLLRRQEKNKKIDRTIWHVLANGTSAITDAENAVNKLKGDVLSKKTEEQEKAWHAYVDDMYYGHLPKGNHTIFLLGKNMFDTLFEQMYIVNVEENIWNAFLKFYFNQYRKNWITKNLLGNFCYCNLRSKKNFFFIIRFFNGLRVEQNYNDTDEYRQFFTNYMSHMAILGYCKHMEYWMFELTQSLKEQTDSALNLLEKLKDDLLERKTDIQVPYVLQEFDDCISFVEHNMELIQCKNGYTRKEEPRMHMEHIQSRWIHQEEVDRLKALKKKCEERQTDSSEFASELEKSYREGRIYLQEYEDI